MPTPTPSSPFISPETLQAWRDEGSSLVVIDVRFDTSATDASVLHQAARIPGAVFADINVEAAGEPGPKTGRLPLPDIDTLQRDARRWGIDIDSRVVIYDDAKGTSAARLWWVLRWAGLRAVHILDGGYGAWTAAGYPSTREAGAVRRGRVELSAGHLALIGGEEALDLARRGTLLDARGFEAYRGQPDEARTGHIPGAHSLPAGRLQGADGRVKAAAALCDIVQDLGFADGQKPVALYCGSGVAAAYGVAALEAAGIASALYPGSWSEYAKNPHWPVAQGPLRG